MNFGSGSKRASVFGGRRILSFSSFFLATVVGITSSFIFSAAYDMAGTLLSSDPPMVSGVWRGDWHGVTAVRIRLEQEGESVSGIARFYRVMVTEEGPQSFATDPYISIVNPRLDGSRLTFTIHAVDELHPAIFVEMEMDFENEEEAVLRSVRRAPIDEPVGEAAPPIKMRRERSF